jgi:carboxyl-terminal processing protease
VQNTFPLPYRTQLKVTTARYYTPSGRCIQLLDYSKRNPDGSAGSIPDSLRNAFKTKNGRTVYDGGGVRPDVVVEDPWNKGIYRLLNERQLLFQFANRWRNTHDSPPSPAAFTLPDDAWNSFVEEAAFDLEIHHRERMLKQSKSLTDDPALDARLLPDTKETSRRAFSDKLHAERKGIQYRLELEIVSRYFYERAEYEKGLRQDPDVVRASTLLSDKNAYDKLLRP